MNIHQQLADEFKLKPEAVAAILAMHEKHYSVAFMVDFRAEEIFHTRENTVRNLLERHEELTRPEEPEEAAPEPAAADTPEDPVRTRLMELALRVLDGRDLGEPIESIALQYTLPDHGVTSAEHVLSRVRDIIVEKIAAHRKWRRSLKNIYSATARFACQLKAGAQDRKGEFRRFHKFSAPLGRMSPEDALMVLRGEKRKILEVKFSIDDDAALKHLYEAVIKTDVPVLRFQLETVVAEAYHQKLKPEIEKELRTDLIARAERMVLSDCANALSQALRHPVLSSKRLLVMDANRDAGFAAVLVEPSLQIARTEKFTFVNTPAKTDSAAPSEEPEVTETLPISTEAQPATTESSTPESTTPEPTDPGPTESVAATAPPASVEASSPAVAGVIESLKKLIQEGKPDLIVIAKRPETRLLYAFIKTLLAKENLTLPVVGAHAMALAFDLSAQQLEHEYPGQDADFLRPLAIARRLVNPVAELAAVSPLSLNLHPLQDDISQTKLLSTLREVFEEMIRPGGVDINQASAGMLRYVPGMEADIAKAIVKFRRQNGRYKSRQDLLKVPGMTPELFLQVAGFVRVHDGTNPLDRTRIHPERYEALRKVAEYLQQDFSKILRRPDLLGKIDPLKFARPGLSAQTLRGLLDEMQSPYTAEPNRPLEIFKYDPKLIEAKDLTVGSTMQGRVTHLTDYGAFVDVGIHQDGLVHKTEMAREFVKEPTRYLRLGQTVTVKVLAVEAGKNRITLTMKDVKQIRAPIPDPRQATAPAPHEGFRGKKPGFGNRPSEGRRDGRDTAQRPGGQRPSGFSADRREAPHDRARGPRPDQARESRPDRFRGDRRDRPQRPQKQAPQPNVFGTFGEAFKKILPAAPATSEAGATDLPLPAEPVSSALADEKTGTED